MILPLFLLALQNPGVLTGQVTDALTGAPVPEAVVNARGVDVLTDADGRYVVRALAPGRYEVRIRRLGFAAARAEALVANGVQARLDVRLTPLPVELSPVAATTAAPATLDHEALVTRGATLAEALDGWAGVTLVQRGPGPAAPTLRGSSPSEVLVLLGGAPINDPFTGVADLRRIGTRDVAQVSVYPAAQGARFGARALAGAIVIVPLGRPAVGGGVSAGSYGAVGGRLSLPFGSLEAQRGPDEYPVTLPATRGGGQAIRTNAEVREVRGTGRWGPLALRLYGSRRGLPGTLSNPTPTAQAEDRWLQVSPRWGGFSLTGDWFSTRTTDRTPPPGAGPSYDSRVSVFGVEGRWSRSFGLALVETGGRIDQFRGDVAGGVAATRRAHVSIRAERAAGRITFSSGARLDLWNGAGSPALSLRGDASWLWRAVRLSLGAGSSASPPVPADLIFHETLGVKPNPDLRPERIALDVEGGVALEPVSRSLRFSASLRGYAGRVKDYVIWAPDFRFVWSPHNFDVRRRGIESSLELRWPRPGLEAQGSVGILRITYDYPGGPQVIYRPRDTESARLVWARGPLQASVGWRRIGERYPNHGGSNPLPPVATWDGGVLARAVLGSRHLDLRLDLHDVGDQRAAFIFDFPSPGRTVTVRCEITTP